VSAADPVGLYDGYEYGSLGLIVPPMLQGRLVVLRVRAPSDMSQPVTELVASQWHGEGSSDVGATSHELRGQEYLIVHPLGDVAGAWLRRDGRIRLTITIRSGERRPNYGMVALAVRRQWVFSPEGLTTRGGFGPQTMIGTAVGDLLGGDSADDELRGLGGDDRLRGGTGDDALLGGSGSDDLDGEDGSDMLLGGPGDDRLSERRFGDDRLDGGPGDDELFGGRGSDELLGGEGDDVLRGGSGRDRTDCGPGEDIVFFNGPSEPDVSWDCEYVIEEPDIRVLRCTHDGTAEGETMLGTQGADFCFGREGDDDLEGAGGDDRLVGGPGEDRLFGRFGRDVLSGDDDDDELEGGRGRDRLLGGAGADVLNGGFDRDALDAGAGDDVLIARGGDDDRLRCGPGDDTVFADSRDLVGGDCETVRRSGTHARRPS